jgi:hypothetical protein
LMGAVKQAAQFVGFVAEASQVGTMSRGHL